MTQDDLDRLERILKIYKDAAASPPHSYNERINFLIISGDLLFLDNIIYSTDFSDLPEEKKQEISSCQSALFNYLQRKVMNIISHASPFDSTEIDADIRLLETAIKYDEYYILIVNPDDREAMHDALYTRQYQVYVQHHLNNFLDRIYDEFKTRAHEDVILENLDEDFFYFADEILTDSDIPAEQKRKAQYLIELRNRVSPPEPAIDPVIEDDAHEEPAFTAGAYADSPPAFTAGAYSVSPRLGPHAYDETTLEGLEAIVHRAPRTSSAPDIDHPGSTFTIKTHLLQTLRLNIDDNTLHISSTPKDMFVHSMDGTSSRRQDPLLIAAHTIEVARRFCFPEPAVMTLRDGPIEVMYYINELSKAQGIKIDFQGRAQSLFPNGHYQERYEGEITAWQRNLAASFDEPRAIKANFNAIYSGGSTDGKITNFLAEHPPLADDIDTGLAPFIAEHGLFTVLHDEKVASSMANYGLLDERFWKDSQTSSQEEQSEDDDSSYQHSKKPMP